MTPPRLLILLFVLAAGLLAGSSGPAPALAWAATCADYPNQAAAQAGGNTRDADGDGVYCESLPCPCSTAAPTAPTTTAPPPPQTAPSGALPTGTDPSTSTSTTPTQTTPSSIAGGTDPAGCTTPAGVQNITFSKTKYPNIRKHFLRALRRGWPRTLVLNRPGASKRRARLLEGVATKPGFDRDEYPPAFGRGKGKGLTKGTDPRGWKADVMLVAASENRSHGATMGLKLRRFCSGTKFRYVFF